MTRSIHVAIVCAGAALGMAAVPTVALQLPLNPPAAPAGARPRQPGGMLRDYLGVYLTIEGARVEGGKVETNTLIVDTVNGEQLKQPVSLLIHNLRGHLRPGGGAS